ncbi:hypothetical protein BDQ12DRAFT_685155 [Crucibulum laeve]|uniref:Zn(2)-C6 fungal-type domain-containing protein n=1 Tax=Crucibulum laeve TaxID=68775 RepID=A0A5C3LX87_9AGAR|nr:hypothetical protein BDQ12DRAFT_685155 [Crucibulum laeve]
MEEYRFDGSHARELEMKRNRGEVSCAECRRLKIKCDKQIPCQSCQVRIFLDSCRSTLVVGIVERSRAGVIYPPTLASTRCRCSAHYYS